MSCTPQQNKGERIATYLHEITPHVEPRHAVQRRAIGNGTMREAHANAAHDRRVREVALETRDGQLLAQVLHDGVGIAEISLHDGQAQGAQLPHEPHGYAGGASVRLTSEFSKSIGFTLCGIVEEPTSESTTRCLR